MPVAEAEPETRGRRSSKWLIPGAISLLIHAGIVVLAFALHANWNRETGIIDAEALDIADSNSLKQVANRPLEKSGAREISNQEMVERLSLPMGLPRNLKCSIAVTVARDGQVLEATMTQSTGNRDFDRSIVEAVFKSSPFPKPSGDQLEAGVYRFELRLGE
jgi:TonB family protein